MHYQLAINEQYAMRTSSTGIANDVLVVVAERGTGLRTFSENVAAMFNRGGADDIREGPNPAMQLVLLKFFFLVFSRRATADMFYPNDLKVVVEILLRELADLPRDKAVHRQGYLQVLRNLLLMSPYRQQGKYRKADVRRALETVWMDEELDDTTRAVAEQILLDCADVLE